MEETMPNVTLGHFRNNPSAICKSIKIGAFMGEEKYLFFTQRSLYGHFENC